MPYIKISLAQKLTPEKQEELVKGLGEALSVIPGKDGRMLIADVEDGKTLFMGGVRQEDFAFIDARYYLKYEYHIKKAFVKAVFDAVSRVCGTPYEKMSMNLNEYTDWGGFGDFRDEYYQDV
jgi:phenylpyruvate tautomerase PptA (4-oxalocrotonate tautomerase family)